MPPRVLEFVRALPFPRPSDNCECGRLCVGYIGLAEASVLAVSRRKSGEGLSYEARIFYTKSKMKNRMCSEIKSIARNWASRETCKDTGNDVRGAPRHVRGGNVLEFCSESEGYVWYGL